MSIVVAMPFASGVIVGTDSRATYGLDQSISDECPKVVVNGAFALGMTGRLLHDGFSLLGAAVDYWKAEDYRITKDNFARFKDAMLALTKKAQPRAGDNDREGFGNAWLVASAEDAEPIIGAVSIDFAGSDGKPELRKAELFQFGPTTPIRVEAIGAAKAAKAVALVTPHAPFRDPSGKLDISAGEAAAFVIDVIAGTSETHPLVGGAIGVTVLRSTPYVSKMHRTVRGSR